MSAGPWVAVGRFLHVPAWLRPVRVGPRPRISARSCSSRVLMPIFAWRRLRSMLEELSAHSGSKKAAELRKRIESRNTDQALAGEAELSMLWALSRVANLTVEPTLPNSTRRPDAMSPDLFPSGPVIVEVRALSDDSFSGKKVMDRTANIISSIASRIRSRSGDHLSFDFYERRYRDQRRRFHRERCADPAFAISPAVEQSLRDWLGNGSKPRTESLRITEGRTDVMVRWSDERPNSVFRARSQMPPVAYDLEDNPVYKALAEKSDQLKGAAPNTLKSVFLFDAGCDLLRQVRPGPRVVAIGGDAIIAHAIRKLHIDMVCVFSAHRPAMRVLGARQPVSWRVTYFDRREGVRETEYANLGELARLLPPPRMEGYQARDAHRQGALAPDRPWYLPTKVVSDRSARMTVRISSRLVLELLAGRIDAEQFRREAFNSLPNVFATALDARKAIQVARFETGGLDEDDDYVVFDVDFPWTQIERKPPRRGPAEAKADE